MTKRVHVLIAGVAILALAVSGLSCSAASAGSKSFTIDGTGFTVEKIDPSYWSDGPIEPTMFLNLYVGYSENLGVDDIENVLVHTPGGDTWVFGSDGFELDTGIKQLSIRMLYNDKDATTRKQVETGTWTLDVGMVGGNDASASILVGEPGSAEAPINLYVCSEETPVVEKTLALAQALVSATTKDASKVTVTFSVADNRVYDGYMWFYDSEGTYLGGSGRFKNAEGDVNSILDRFANDGSSCTLTIDATTLPGTTLSSFASIDECVVVVVDGEQYPGHPTWWDYRSIGPRYAVPTP